MNFLRLVGRRIELAIPVKRKSPACEMSARSAKPSDKKTRPPAEYDAHAALPCPDIEIGSRQPGTGI
jgi:hypothetical protein